MSTCNLQCDRPCVFDASRFEASVEESSTKNKHMNNITL